MLFYKLHEEYKLTFWVETDKTVDEVETLLYDVNCDDADVHKTDAHTYVHFNRKAANCGEAVSDAWSILEAAGLGVKGVLEGHST